MKYTDLIAHLNKIQEAMWKTIPGNVSVFIGAGFSRNSNPIDISNRIFPDWTQLSTAMIEELYPNGSISDKEREKLINKAEVPAQILRFSQEYKELFGQIKLDNLLKNNIPDDKYEPNELYFRLLELPWKDIFTTNYDTLLERATEKVFERDYQLITKIDDLAGSCSPRIIKLHGTFPNITPFIITEEEFRTYSNVYKPFVNTVRQSLIENIFVLIGFSGDDPNFQSWISWVRDNMHDYTQKIYICTLGNLTEYTEAQKRLLNSKNIEILDLSLTFYFKDSFLYGITPNYPDAFKWLFEYLKKGRKVSPLEWPDESRLPMPSYIPVDSPDKDQQHIQNLKISDELDKYLIKIRRTYPGWIITPEKTRNLLEYNVHNLHLNDIIDGCTNDSMIIRILVNYIWINRLQYLSLYIYDLEIIDTYLKNLREDRERLNLALSDTGTLDNYTELLLYLISDARENKEQERVDSYFKILSENTLKTQTLKHHYFYEKIMCDVYELNVNKIYDQLSNWQIEIKYPLFFLIKASLLCEFGKTKEASVLLRTMLESIRRNREDIISNKAIEGICLYLLDLIRTTDYRNNNDDNLSKKEMERLYSLDMDKCNPHSEISRMKLDIFKAAIPAKPIKERRKLFDPFSYRIVHRFIGNSASNNARRIINFYDYMPIPMKCVNTITIDKEQILITVNTFKFEQPLFAISFLLRYQSVELIEQVITRFYVGAIDQKVFDYLFETYYQSLIDNIDYVNNNQYGNVVLSIIACQIELLSRLIFRLNEEQYNSVIFLLKKIYSSSIILNNWNFSKQKKNLINRLMENKLFYFNKKIEVCQLLFDAPLPDPKLLKDIRYESPEPWDELINDSFEFFDKIIINSENIKQLITLTLNTDETIRSFAIRRLFYFYKIKKMTPNDIEEFKENLWSLTDEYGLPKDTGLKAWVSLDMPCPDNVDVKEFLKRYLLSIDFKSYMLTGESIAFGSSANQLIEKINNIIDSVRNVFKFKRDYNYIEFTESELRGLLKKIIISWQSIKQEIDKKIHIARDEFFNDLKRNYESIANLITAVILPNIGCVYFEEEDELHEMATILEKNHIYIPQILIFLNKKIDQSDLEEKFYIGLLAHDEDVVRASVKAITFWCHLKAGHKGIANVPQKLIDEFVDIIKNIRQPAFNILIERLNFLITQVPAIFKSEQYEVIIKSFEKFEILTRLPDIKRITDRNEPFTGFCPFEELPDYRSHLSNITATTYTNIKKGNINVHESYIDLLTDLGKIYFGDVFPEVVKPWNGLLVD